LAQAYFNTFSIALRRVLDPTVAVTKDFNSKNSIFFVAIPQTLKCDKETIQHNKTATTAASSVLVQFPPILGIFPQQPALPAQMKTKPPSIHWAKQGHSPFSIKLAD
jgi:hypothetical protein